jgi:hypothetical protein
MQSGADGMDFPKQKMRFTSTHGGDRYEEGWLVLDIRNVDLEGVGQIYISLADVSELKAKGDQQVDLLRQARSLLGGGEVGPDDGDDE